MKDIGQVDRYTSNTIPPEWDSKLLAPWGNCQREGFDGFVCFAGWLRGLRDDPPTMEVSYCLLHF